MIITMKKLAPQAEIDRRRAAYTSPERPPLTGYLKRYAKMVSSADKGAVFKD